MDPNGGSFRWFGRTSHLWIPSQQREVLTDYSRPVIGGMAMAYQEEFWKAMMLYEEWGIRPRRQATKIQPSYSHLMFAFMESKDLGHYPHCR